MDPQSLAVDMVLSFGVFFDRKLEISIDEVLLVSISFVKLVTTYKIIKEVVTVEDSTAVEKI